MVCKGVQALHDAGIAHCDIKPQNTLLHTPRAAPGEERETIVVLMDLGSVSPRWVGVRTKREACGLGADAEAALGRGPADARAPCGLQCTSPRGHAQTPSARARPARPAVPRPAWAGLGRGSSTCAQGSNP